MIGGVTHVPTLIEAGAPAVFGPGTNIPKAAAELVGKLNAKMGYKGGGWQAAE